MYKHLYKSEISLRKSFGSFEYAWLEMKRLITRERETNSAGNTNDSSHRSPIRLIQNTAQRIGIKIRTAQAFIPDRKILPVARVVYEKLGEFDTAHENPNISLNDQKELAIDLLHILEEYLPLGKTVVQQSIESTRSAHINKSNKKTTAQGVQTWSLCFVEGERFPGNKNLHEMIENLIDYEHLVLEDDDIQFLEETFGADPDHLRSLTQNKIHHGEDLFPMEQPESFPSLEQLLKDTPGSKNSA